jgi:hypothetical protein
LPRLHLACLPLAGLGILFLSFSNFALGQTASQPLNSPPDWSEGAIVPTDGRGNIFHLDDISLQKSIRAGRETALNYPIESTGILLPIKPIERFLSGGSNDPFKIFLQTLIRGIENFSSFDDLENWIGLQTYPKAEGSGAYFIPRKAGLKKDQRMGLSIIETSMGHGFTIGCAECHAANLFGRRVIGLSNRFPNANRFFAEGLRAAPFVDADFFQWATSSTDGERKMFARAKKHMRFVGAKPPVQLGLDTALAQVAISLSKRAPDEWATMVAGATPRPEPLSTFPADSKPAVWWNVKYKNRWLSDGSVISGNPVFTNLLWNEIGRGSDLHVLNNWLEENGSVIESLTAAVFASEAPRYTDFYSSQDFEIERAKAGEKLFNQTCSRCHGTYEKAWSLPNAHSLNLNDQLVTTRVRYWEKTPVVNVGTDPNRYLGMRSLEQLNALAISKENGIVVKAQNGYVPPPLVGIWARWPYFHNNSAPSLCSVLTKAALRPKTYWAREAENPKTDFDSFCNGYPRKNGLGLSKDRFYDTRREGLNNTGHDEGIFLIDGKEIFTIDQKIEIIRFLQTL